MEKDVNIRVNPVSNTAITTLVMLANAGYDDAMTILGKMGIEEEKIFHGIDKDDVMNRPSDIVRELRYVAINRTIEESGLKTLVDLPCGYTPKVFEFIKKGMHYIGCDLPAVIDDFGPIIASVTNDDQKKMIDFKVVDVTNYDSMKAAADLADGPVCIATEGLTVYLTPEETAQFLRNIRLILAEKGGCWLNADVETLGYYMAVFKAVAGERAYELLDAASRGFSGQSDTNIAKNSASVVKKTDKTRQVDYDAIERRYKSFGLLVEKVPYYRDDFTLHLYDSMSDEEVKSLKENIKHVNIWKVTADPDYKENTGCAAASGVAENMELPFEVTSLFEDGVFEVSIQGRMDTITAPELLKQFEDAEGEKKKIIVDVSRMPYVSSAGLRVLMIMYKSLEDKSGFEIKGVSDAVREIFETTGFDEFFLKQ